MEASRWLASLAAVELLMGGPPFGGLAGEDYYPVLDGFSDGPYPKHAGNTPDAHGPGEALLSAGTGCHPLCGRQSCQYNDDRSS